MSNEEHAEDEPHSPENSNGTEGLQARNRAFWHFENHVALTGEEYDHVLRFAATALMLPSPLIESAVWAGWADANAPTFHSPPAGMLESESLRSMSFEEDEPPTCSNQIYFQKRETDTDESVYPYEEDEAPRPFGRLGVFVVFDEGDQV